MNMSEYKEFSESRQANFREFFNDDNNNRGKLY